jgi:hypothetical protein
VTRGCTRRTGSWRWLTRRSERARESSGRAARSPVEIEDIRTHDRGTPNSSRPVTRRTQGLLGLVETSSEASLQPQVQVVGGRDDAATWLVDRGWAVFARPARELVSGGREIAQFELPGGETLSASYDPARKSVFLPFSPTEAYTNYLTEAWKDNLPKRGLSSRQLDAFYRVKRFVPRRIQIRARRMLIRREGLRSSLAGLPTRACRTCCASMPTASCSRAASAGPTFAGSGLARKWPQ